MPTGMGANPMPNVPPPPFDTCDGGDPQQNASALPLCSSVATPTPGGQSPFGGIAESPAPGGHTPFSGIPPPFSSSAASAAGAISQQSNVYAQPGVKRTVHLDYVLYSRLVIALAPDRQCGPLHCP
ncbi:hypothetical protein PCASD_12847 [Puccinia coronata f. sp. avenae]|uniref:Uncharacterized protein n=1 Tax=Puccinia coronata f. sp. avenae TaxID=200324 RepID=A0A2N5TAY0_9BASI|nr:hypothetical protein PCASD_12847 [Puccinia coronata f. sp. avenae]